MPMELRRSRKAPIRLGEEIDNNEEEHVSEYESNDHTSFSPGPGPASPARPDSGGSVKRRGDMRGGVHPSVFLAPAAFPTLGFLRGEDGKINEVGESGSAGRVEGSERSDEEVQGSGKSDEVKGYGGPGPRSAGRLEGSTEAFGRTGGGARRSRGKSWLFLLLCLWAWAWS